MVLVIYGQPNSYRTQYTYASGYSKMLTENKQTIKILKKKAQEKGGLFKKIQEPQMKQ